MKQVLYLCCVVGLMACNSKKPESAQTYAATPTGLQGIQNSAPSVPVAATGQTAGNAGVNPPHGAPGHRCDIAVGASLNAAPSTPVTPTVNPQPINTTVPAVTPTTAPVEAVLPSSGQKLNPKHGEPGHRCEIAVGAPLDSKPQTTTTTTTPKAVDVKLPANLPKEAKNGVKLNPKHGAPGHRCEIAVGAPLT